MKKLISTLFISIFISISLIGQNVGDSPQTKIGFTTKIKSEILEDSLEIFTHLPFNYKKDKENPLILLLDPHAAFKAFSLHVQNYWHIIEVYQPVLSWDFRNTNMSNMIH